MFFHGNSLKMVIIIYKFMFSLCIYILTIVKVQIRNLFSMDNSYKPSPVYQAPGFVVYA